MFDFSAEAGFVGLFIARFFSATNLPGDLTEFVGREEEISRLKKLLGEKRLVTLTGPGGIGKSRLAIQVAAELLEDYRDGTCFVALASLASADFLIGTVAEALRLPLSGPQDPLQQLLD